MIAVAPYAAARRQVPESGPLALLGVAAEPMPRPTDPIPIGPPSADPPATPPRLWGLTPVEIHDRFWAARGAQVVRQGSPCRVDRAAELFLLTDARTLVIFRLRDLVDVLSWVRPGLLYVRVRNDRARQYAEALTADADGRYLTFRRRYRGAAGSLARVAVTRDPELARAWASAEKPRAGWRLLRDRARRVRREVAGVRGRVFDAASDEDTALFLKDLVRCWRHPGASIPGLRRLAPGVWAHQTTAPAAGTRFVGPVWVGTGRSVAGVPCVPGPAVLWDDPAASATPDPVLWHALEPVPDSVGRAAPGGPGGSASSALYRAAKRMFDVTFSAAALAVTLPLYPLVMLAIWLEDGRPFFFAHRRETVGGREFPCLKFRSMRKDAEQVKADLARANQADGPQFFVDRDPRLTRVGRLIRRLNVDELPQFLNVLAGHMSVVGPRPSPHAENQCCPAWREARLSVRPGVTGLWQVRRTRRRGLDFQEWIRFDLEYVRSAGWRLDLSIIAATVLLVVRGSRPS